VRLYCGGCAACNVDCQASVQQRAAGTRGSAPRTGALILPQLSIRLACQSSTACCHAQRPQLFTLAGVIQARPSAPGRACPASQEAPREHSGPL
jgi:hypothetical protein